MMNIAGMNVVVTGKIAGETRVTAQAKLSSAGAYVQDTVTKDTDLLVCGDAVGRVKTEKAKALGAKVVTWEQVWAAVPDQVRKVEEVTVRRTGQKLEVTTTSEGVTVAEAVVAEEAKPRKRPSIRQIQPMLCQPETEVPVGARWVYEVKWDGFRCIAHVQSGNVTLRSRNGKPLSFPKIEDALKSLPDCILDGEAVILDKDGNANVNELVDGSAAASYVVYDLIDCLGKDVRALSLEDRRDLLTELIPEASDGGQAVALSPWFDDGEALLTTMRERGSEGIVAKSRESIYEEGRRSPAWIKVKLRLEQEFVVFGWTEGKNGNAGHIGGLLLGVYDDDGMPHYCGRCGVSTVDEADRLEAKMTPVEKPKMVGLPTDKTHREAHYVAPELVVQVAFQRWTSDKENGGALWHPIYLHERTDKKPTEVRRET